MGGREGGQGRGVRRLVLRGGCVRRQDGWRRVATSTRFNIVRARGIVVHRGYSTELMFDATLMREQNTTGFPEVCLFKCRICACLFRLKPCRTKGESWPSR